MIPVEIDVPLLFTPLQKILADEFGIRPEQMYVTVAITVPGEQIKVMRVPVYGRGVLPRYAVWLAGDPNDTTITHGRNKFAIWHRVPDERVCFEQVMKWASTSEKKPTHWTVVPNDSVPKERDYRNAWVCEREEGVELPNSKRAGRPNGKFRIVHDMKRARDLHRQKLREARGPLLASLDVDAIRADEAGNLKAKAKVVARKQGLRDITQHPDIEAARTIEELRQVTLGIL